MQFHIYCGLFFPKNWSLSPCEQRRSVVLRYRRCVFGLLFCLVFSMWGENASRYDLSHADNVCTSKRSTKTRRDKGNVCRSSGAGESGVGGWRCAAVQHGQTWWEKEKGPEQWGRSEPLKIPCVHSSVLLLFFFFFSSSIFLFLCGRRKM